MGLDERLSSVNVSEYTSIKSLRERILSIVNEHLTRNERARGRAAFEPFYFCASDTIVIPTPWVARNLYEFTEALRKVSIHSIHYHFINARLRLKLNSNDFSLWLENDLDLGALADRINRIDIYTATLNDVRNQILRVIESAA